MIVKDQMYLRISTFKLRKSLARKKMMAPTIVLQQLLVCQLSPLSKSPSARPIGIGEVM